LLDEKRYTDVEIAGKRTTLPSAEGNLIAWLTGLAGTPAHSAPSASNWLTPRGDADRNAQIAGGRPHLRPRWEARVVNEPATELYLTGRINEFLQRGVVAIPAARPIAIDDVVVMRTPDNIVAIDWQSGKRIWETRDESEFATDPAVTEIEAAANQQWGIQGRPLDARMWDDALMTSLSSDGKRIFVLRGVTLARDEQFLNLQPIPGMGRGLEATEATNQLVAYELATQGKLVWELDGSRLNGPLAGAFFLGAPLAIDNTLYVLAEIGSAIYLVALDSASGQPLWKQQLVGLEQGIVMDPSRLRMAVSPSYEGGVLVCPTAASAVVAFDVGKREFAWVYRYARETQTPNDARNIWAQPIQNQMVRLNDQWLDSAAVIADGHVFVTPPESADLHCLDLRTGKLLWKHPQGELLFVGAVDQGRILLVGANSVQALKVGDHAPAWDKDSVPLPAGALPAGQGYLSDGFYYLPLSSGEIAQVDMSTGEISTFATARPEAMLGNLICHRGSILSQSPLLLDKFEQLTILKQRTDAALAKNPHDPAALRELAEIKRSEGATAEAVALLKRAYELAPDDVATQQSLLDLLLEASATDYATYRADVTLASQLAGDRAQEIELLRIDAAGLDELGERLRAVDAYLRLADYSADEPAQLRIAPGYTVRSDRWIAGRLGKLWEAASAEERAAIEKKIAERRPASDVAQTAAEYRHFLAHLDQLPGAGEVRLALAKFLIERERKQEAELELLHLTSAKSGSLQAKASELLDDPGGSSVKSERGNDGRDWPRGQVEAMFVPASAMPRERGTRAQKEAQTSYRPLRIEQDYRPVADATQWFISADCSFLLARNGFGEDVLELPVDQADVARPYRDGSLIHAARVGHLLVLALNGQFVAIDARPDRPSPNGEILWRSSPFSSLDGQGLRSRRGAIVPQARIGRRPVYHTWSDRKRIAGAAGSSIGSLGPVSPCGVVLQERDQLKCVDPLSGDVLWSRTDIPAGCELFGDSELVFAADVSADLMHVIRVVDGELVGNRPLSKAEWLMTTGRNLAQLSFATSRGNRTMSIRLVEAWSQDVLYEGEFSLGARISVVEPDALAVYEPSGKFRLIDTKSGKTIIDEELQPSPELQNIYTVRGDRELVLMVASQPQQKQIVPIAQAEQPPLSGPVYAFNLETGRPSWPGPAIVRNRGIVLSQPPALPVLVFADRKVTRDAASGGTSQLRVLCLDKRTGQTIYRNDQLPESGSPRFRIRRDRDQKSTVALDLGAGRIQLTMTDRPRPPQPPANDDLEAPREIVEHGLRGLGRRLSGALRGESENTEKADQLREQMLEQARQRRLDLQKRLQQEGKPGEVQTPEETDDD
jgi:outer membrane protein assembly factor BamB